MLWCQSAQNIGAVFNHKLKSALKCTVSLQCMHVPDRQTDKKFKVSNYFTERFVLCIGIFLAKYINYGNE